MATPPVAVAAEVAVLRTELERLRQENTGLRERQDRAFLYIRSKIDQFLELMGTLPLRAGELDDDHLVSLDPIGIVADSFRQILDHLHETNDRLGVANEEIKAIFHSAGNGIMVVDRNGHIVSANQRLKELFAPEAGNLVGHTCSEMICHGKTSIENCVFQQVLRTGRGECRNDWARENRHFEVVGSPIFDRHGELSHTVILYTEITARIAAEEELRIALATTSETLGRIDGILRSVGDPLLVIDPAGRVVLFNPSAQALLSQADIDPVGQPLELLLPLGAFPPGGLTTALAAIGSGASVDCVIPGHDGTRHIYAARVSPLLQAGVNTGLILLLQDVTRERLVEQMKSDFVSTAAHEFRTPLATILGFSELLLEEPDLPEAQEYLTLIRDKAESLSGIVNKLLDISRIESGEELPLQRSDWRLDDLLQPVLPALVKKHLQHRFELMLHDPALRVLVDAETMQEVFENILSNAVKYSPAGGRISIASEAAGSDQVLLTIGDEGIGMSEEQVAHVFDKFYRGDASNTAIRGTGLGMTIVRHIVEAHGGCIWVRSKPGCGTTVSFTLPLAS